jgi:hypothetical protein
VNASPGASWRSLRFFQLFVFMLLVLLLIPLQLRVRAVGIALVALYVNAVVVSLSVSQRWARLRWAFVAIGVGGLVLKLVPMADPDAAAWLYVTSRLLVAVMLGGCVAATLQYVLRGAEISVDRIFGAIVAYMLAAFGFATLYQALLAVAPESFALPGSSGLAGEPERLEVQLIYFSFVTIATLGYGDITPRLPLAQMLSVLEAVLGQFYVAVVIAWLVSVYAGQRRAGS